MVRKESIKSSSFKDSEEILSIEGGTGESFNKKLKKENKTTGEVSERIVAREVES
jgi:hypothetical protein